MTRVFISINIPENIRKEIGNLQNQLSEFNGKITEQENLHLTLKFLGEISDEQIKQIKKRLNEIQFKRFETQINGIGVFSEKFVRIVWLHLTNCEDLQKKVDEALSDIFPKEKRFMSHLTIARVKSLKDKKSFLDNLSKIEISKLKFDVDKFGLKESVLKPKGPSYKIIEEYALIKKKSPSF